MVIIASLLPSKCRQRLKPQKAPLLNLVGKVLASLPGEVRVVASEVPVGSGLAHDGAAELEVPDDAAGAEVEVLVDDVGELSIGLARCLLGGAVGVNKDGEGVGDADGVGELDEGALAEASVDEGLGDPAGGVGGGPVDLSGVLSGEGACRKIRGGKRSDELEKSAKGQKRGLRLSHLLRGHPSLRRCR